MMGIFRTTTLIIIAVAYLTGFLTHFLYQKWAGPTHEIRGIHGHPVTFAPLPPLTQGQVHGDTPDTPWVNAADLAKIRALAGSRARVRGRIYRIGHSRKSNTYFLNFGPSRSSFTAVVFSSALERFKQGKIPLMNYEGQEVELTGEIRNHPRYGLEMILEDPSQIRMLK